LPFGPYLICAVLVTLPRYFVSFPACVGRLNPSAARTVRAFAAMPFRLVALSTSTVTLAGAGRVVRVELVVVGHGGSAECPLSRCRTRHQTIAVRPRRASSATSAGIGRRAMELVTGAGPPRQLGATC
jgi:hypothetical protein